MTGINLKKINVTINLNVLYAIKKYIYPAYVSKCNSNREKQVILLMISKGENANRWKPYLRELSPKDINGIILQ